MEKPKIEDYNDEDGTGFKYPEYTVALEEWGDELKKDVEGMRELIKVAEPHVSPWFQNWHDAANAVLKKLKNAAE